MPTYQCVTCGREMAYEGRMPELYPFCSPRCKLADLGKWLREQYAINRDLTPEELGESSPPASDSPKE